MIDEAILNIRKHGKSFTENVIICKLRTLSKDCLTCAFGFPTENVQELKSYF
jgi:hypothetical protein